MEPILEVLANPIPCAEDPPVCAGPIVEPILEVVPEPLQARPIVEPILELATRPDGALWPYLVPTLDLVDNAVPVICGPTTTGWMFTPDLVMHLDAQRDPDSGAYDAHYARIQVYDKVNETCVLTQERCMVVVDDGPGTRYTRVFVPMEGSAQPTPSNGHYRGPSGTPVDPTGEGASRQCDGDGLSLHVDLVDGRLLTMVG